MTCGMDLPSIPSLTDIEMAGAGEPDRALLSTYLGHVDPVSTYWYLSAAPELLTLVGDRLEAAPRRCRMTALAPTLQAFFTERLILQRQASPHTLAAYRGHAAAAAGLRVREERTSNHRS